MARWIITYSKDNNTSTLEIDAAQKPDMDAAVGHVLKWARQHLEAGEYGDGQDDPNEPAVRLLERYGVTLTGITKA